MNTACRAQCPILLVHGTADETVPVTDAQAIRNSCRGKKPELLLIEGGNHDSREQAVKVKISRPDPYQPRAHR